MLKMILSEPVYEGYTNYKKERLFSKDIILKDPSTLKEIQRVKVTYIRQLEREAIMMKLKQNALDHLVEFSYGSFYWHVTSEEIGNLNKPVYDYFCMSEANWLELEDTTIKAIQCLYNYLSNLETIYHLKPIFTSLTSIEEEMSKHAANIENGDIISTFLNFPEEWRELLFYHISNACILRADSGVSKINLENFLGSISRNLSDISGIILVGPTGSGKSVSIKNLVDKENIFLPDISNLNSDCRTEFKFSLSESPFVALDETEYFSTGSIQKFQESAINALRIPIFSAQNKFGDEPKVFKVLGGNESLEVINIEHVLPLFSSSKQLGFPWH
ncbi:hypothetical protein A7M79_01020 [Acinetobacter baumannii]|uniref:hypothetical protein n=1 Tax=Acinetobacter baumannii TaxID=470 RepID=UPI0008DCE6B6|nr:hypothetical protein [Acinetobacter baumannii]OIH12099.1 hypothetical protein A7M79_01020 [Acinetobacter baumannii]